MRSEESIVDNLEVHIKHLLDTGAVKDWNREDAIKTRAKVLSRKFVDDAHKEKSRWCARVFATYKDPSMFAAASDVDNTAQIDLLAVKRGHSIMCFDAVALIFVEAQHVLWQCLKVRKSRRKAARVWQNHIVDTPQSMECLGTFKQSLKPLTIFYSSEFDIALDLHVDGGCVTGPAEKMMEVFAYLETKNVGVGNLFRACWSSEGYQRRVHVGERTGQV